MGQVESGSEYIDTQSAITTNNVYGGKNGLKFSSSSKNGTLTFTLAKPIRCSEIVVTASQYGSEQCSLNLNEKGEQTVTGDNQTYTYKFDNEEVTEIALAATKRLYVESITFALAQTKPAAPVLSMEEGYNTESPVNLTEYSNGEKKYFDVTVSWTEGMKLVYTVSARRTMLNGTPLVYPEQPEEESTPAAVRANGPAKVALKNPVTGTISGASSAVFSFASDGEFSCYVEDAAGNQSNAVSMTFQGQSTGVEDIIANGADDSEAVYYNMQGVRVANPAAGGLYIRVQGSKAAKVLVK